MDKIFKIYKISFPNGKFYIGQTYNVEKRWKEHLNEAKHSDYKVYRAMRKYSITLDDFSIEEDNILTEEEADIREIYYIEKYNSFYNGYNSTLGGKKGCIAPSGENHPKAVLDDEELYELRRIRATKEFTCGELYNKYNNILSYNGFEKLWNYESRPEIASEYNTPELLEFYKLDRRTRQGEKHANSKLTDEEVINIRKRYYIDGETTNEIYEDFKELYSLSGFRKIIMGTSYTHIPIPEKSLKCKKKLPRLTKEEVVELRKRYNNGESLKELKQGKYSEYSDNNFRNMLTGKTYKNY